MVAGALASLEYCAKKPMPAMTTPANGVVDPTRDAAPFPDGHGQECKRRREDGTVGCNGERQQRRGAKVSVPSVAVGDLRRRRDKQHQR